MSTLKYFDAEIACFQTEWWHQAAVCLHDPLSRLWHINTAFVAYSPENVRDP